MGHCTKPRSSDRAVTIGAMIKVPPNTPKLSVGQRQVPQGTRTLPGERLSKRVMQLKGCSRREAEQYIEGGWVLVDGQVVEEPMARVAQQTITIDPQANLMALDDVTLLLHKPPGFDAMAPLGVAGRHVKPAQQLLLPANHAADDPSGMRVLKRHFARLTACVPLEMAASGLVVFTQDWRVLRKLSEDAAFIEHELRVDVLGNVSPEALQRLNATHADVPAVRVSVNSTTPDLTRLRVVFKGNHPGLVAWLCDQAALKIGGITRLRIGRVALGHLAQGQWRFLPVGEKF